MCVQEDEQVDQDNDNMDKILDNRRISWPLHCDLLHAQMDNSEKDSSFGVSNGQISVANSFPVSLLFLFFFLSITIWLLIFEHVFFNLAS